jgi:hypothetical protein
VFLEYNFIGKHSSVSDTFHMTSSVGMETEEEIIKFEAVTVVSLKIILLLDVTPCNRK